MREHSAQGAGAAGFAARTPLRIVLAEAGALARASSRWRPRTLRCWPSWRLTNRPPPRHWRRCSGPNFSAALAAKALGRDTLDLAEPRRELEAAQVIRDGAFAHDLIFEATLRTVPKPIAGRIERLLGRSGAAQANEAAAILGEHGDPYMTMLVQLDLADTLAPAEAEALSARVQDTADAMEYAGIGLKARLRRARHRHRAGDARAAAGLLRDALASFGGVQPADLYRPEMWWSACEIFAAAGEREAAREALARTARWVREAAAQQVPDEFRDSFLNRNPVNRAILAAVSRQGPGEAGG